MKPHGATVRRPMIGVTPDLAAATAEAPSPRYEMKTAYADAVLRAGGLPLLLPYSTDPTVVEAYLERVSALVLTGGAFDIPPEAYGATPSPQLGPTKPARTAFETALLKGAIERRLPVLGVCGGMQLINVVFGGTLVQDIATELPTAKSHQQSHERSQPHHPVEIKDGSRLADWLGKGQLMVNSTHHQAVKVLGPSLVASAVAPDGVVEGVESSAHPFIVGVQWHPEMLIDTVPFNLGLYKGLVTKAKDVRR